MRHRNRLAFCAVLAALQAGATEIQLFPAGEFRAIDGRPEGLAAWRIDARVAERLRSKFASRANPLPIDYEHQTLHAPTNGQPVPAAGWLKSVEWREGQGFFGTVEWTERAKSMIAAGEYRFISPLFSYDTKTGEPVELMPPALVNYPAIDGMQAVALSALAESWNETTPTQETSMNELLKAVLTALGLKEDANQESVTAALAALQAKAESAAALDTKVKELEPQIAALKAQTPDPAKYVPVQTVTDLQGQIAALSARINGRELDDVVTAAISEGKLLPAMEAWARDLGKKDIAALKAYVDAAQPVAALSALQTKGKPPVGLVNGKDSAAIAAAASALMSAEAARGVTLTSAQAVERVCAAA